MDRRNLARAMVVLVAAGPAAACSGSDPASVPEESVSPSGSIFTLTPLPVPPEPPPSGKLLADMRQSSRDAAAGRMEVWIDNDTADALRPRRITYSDGRFRSDLPAERLRLAPSQSERGFPITLPARPACGSAEKSGTVTVEYAGTSVTMPVDDPTDVVGRYTSARCTEIDVARIAELSWDDAVPQDGAGGEGKDGSLTLVVRPSGRGRGTVSLDTVSGTPVLAPVGSDVWRPDVTISAADRPSRVSLPIKPNRCDAHAFAESGGATAFMINLHVDGRPAQITLRMSPAGAAAAIEFARISCGMLEVGTDTD